MDQNSNTQGLSKKNVLLIAVFLTIIFLLGGYLYISKQDKAKTAAPNPSSQQENSTQTPQFNKQQNAQIGTPVQNQTNSNSTQSSPNTQSQNTSSTQATPNPTSASNTSQNNGFLR